MRGFIERAIALVQRDAPRCAAGVADALGPIGIAIVIDGEPALIRAPAGQLTVASPDSGGGRGEVIVEVVTRGEVVLDLVDGADELLPVILANRVRVRTPPEHAYRLFEVVKLFVEGCARSAGGPALLDEFRTHVAAAAKRSGYGEGRMEVP
jgi:hypothetical protein